MTYLPRRIQPPFTLYTLRAEPGTRNSPPVPAVHLIEEESETGNRHRTTHTLTPSQARDLAYELIRASNAAEGKRTPRPSAVIQAEAAAAKARAVTEGTEYANGLASGLARAVTITERSGRHVSPAVREHLVEQVVDAAKHLRAMALNGVDADSGVWLAQVGLLGDRVDRLHDFDAATTAEVSA